MGGPNFGENAMKIEPQRETMPSRSVRRIVAAVVALGMSVSAMLGFASPANAACSGTYINDCRPTVVIGDIEPSIHQWLYVSGPADSGVSPQIGASSAR